MAETIQECPLRFGYGFPPLWLAYCASHWLGWWFDVHAEAIEAEYIQDAYAIATA